MLMETLAYDCFTADIDTSAESSDSEEYMPPTPRMSTAEQIEILYSKLQFMRDDLDRLHREEGLQGDVAIGDDRCVGPVQVVAHEAYWGDEDDPSPGKNFSVTGREHDGSHALVGSVGGASMMTPPTYDIGRMPLEILIYVFELVLEADGESLDDAADFGGPRGWMAPVVLCHVCQHWRTIVLGTSSIWTLFSLVIDRPPLSVGGLKASLDLWLQGSKQTDVAVNLDVDPACEGVLDRELMGQLKEMLKRCWRFRVNVSHDMFCGLLGLQLPRLRTLEVRTSWLAGDIHGSTIHAPKLQKLTMLGPSMVRFAKEVLPWAQLREYEGTCWADVQRHFEILRLSPNLECCTLYPIYETKGSTMPIRLARLRYLRLVSFLGASITGFLRYFEVPMLEELKLEIPKESPGYGRTMCPKAGVLDLLERSGVRLRNLELVGMEDVVI